jgi:hypothetical protein
MERAPQQQELGQFQESDSVPTGSMAAGKLLEATECILEPIA